MNEPDEIDQAKKRIVSEYERRYPDWTNIRVTELVEDVFGGALGVVQADDTSGHEWDEICFIEANKGVRIFSTTEELGRYLESKAKAPFLDYWRRSINLGIAVVSLLATAVLISVAWLNRFDPILSNLVVHNFAAIIGIPFSFIAAFVVVALFRQGEAPMNFAGFGVNLRGAAGEIVLWLLCFVAINGSISLLWKN